MSTRCNIKIIDENRVVWLYRHCDGYLAETGADLVETLGKQRYGAYDSAPTLAQRLLLGGIEDDEHGYKGHKMMYELTGGVHGDIEHLYELRLVVAPDGVGQVLEWGHATGYGPSLTANVRTYTLPRFIEQINAERRAANTRMDMLCKQNPGYAKLIGSDRYTMLEIA